MKTKFSTVGLMFLLGIAVSYGQKYGTKTGALKFEASVASFEEVKATHQNASAILNTANGDFAALALINGFRFKVALMEEHFNENYMESSTYPKTTVRGVIQEFNAASLTANEQEFMLEGTISMHGETQPLMVPVFIKKQDNTIVLQANFELRPEDFNIEIPKVVAGKIAEIIQVTAQFNLTPQ